MRLLQMSLIDKYVFHSCDSTGKLLQIASVCDSIFYLEKHYALPNKSDYDRTFDCKCENYIIAFANDCLVAASLLHLLMSSKSPTFVHQPSLPRNDDI